MLSSKNSNWSYNSAQTAEPLRCFLAEKQDILWPFPPNYGDIRLCVSDAQMCSTNKSISAEDQVLGPLQGDICSGQGKVATQLKNFVNALRANLALGKKKSFIFGRNARVEGAEGCWVVWRTPGLQKVIDWSITVGAAWADPSTFPNNLCSVHLALLDPNDWEKSSRWLQDFRCGGHTFMLTFEQGISFAFFSRSYFRTDNLFWAMFQIISWFLFEKKNLFFYQIWSVPSSELGDPSIIIALILHSDGCSCDSQTQRKDSHNV